RTLGAWPADVIELADALGLEQFAVAGVPGGGAYAAAWATSASSAAWARSRIRPSHHRAAFALMRRLPGALCGAPGSGRRGCAGRRAPYSPASPRRGPRRTARSSPGRECARCCATTPWKRCASPRGAARELLLGRPWDIALAEIRGPARL